MAQYNSNYRGDQIDTAVLKTTNASSNLAYLGCGIGTCSTAAATAAKVVTLNYYELVTNGIVAVTFSNDVPANATLNINSKGAKAIYHKGAAITANTIKANDTITFCYDGTNYVVTSLGGEIPTFTGATSSANGSKGLVPAPAIADKDKFLKGDGTWSEAGGGGKVTVLTGTASYANAYTTYTSSGVTGYTDYSYITIPMTVDEVKNIVRIEITFSKNVTAANVSSMSVSPTNNYLDPITINKMCFGTVSLLNGKLFELAFLLDNKTLYFPTIKYYVLSRTNNPGGNSTKVGFPYTVSNSFYFEIMRGSLGSHITPIPSGTTISYKVWKIE